MLRDAVEGQENQPDAARVGGERASLPANLAARVEEIVRAAEREAGVVQRDLEAQQRVAETEARRYLIDAKRQPDPFRSMIPPPAPDDASREKLDAARLVAIEMAVAGRTRNEVDRHVRDSFRIDDTGGLLDDVFGGDSPGTSWGRRPL